MVLSHQRILRQILACSSVIFLQFLIGVGYGWFAPTLQKFSEFNFTENQVSWLASVNELGKLIGPFIAPLIVDNIGRRYSLFSVTIVYCLVWFSTIFTRNFYILCTIRILLGFTNCVNDVADCAYVAENCSPNMRGIVGSVLMLTFFAALSIENIIASNLSYTGTAAVNCLLAVSTFGTLYFCTETPYFLFMKGKCEEARENLTWLSGNMIPEEVAEESEKIEHSIEEERMKKESIKSLLSSPVNLRGIFLAVSTHVIDPATGFIAIVSYNSVIFSPSKSWTVKDFAVLYSVMPLLSALFSLFIIEKLNRRSLFVGCHVFCICCNICSFLLLYFNNAGYQILYYPWLLFGSISMYGLCIGLLVPTGYTLKGELLPFSVRAIGAGLCATGQSLTTFIGTMLFFPVTDKFGMEFNFLMYALISLLGAVLYYYKLPETRGKTLHELQHLGKSEL